MNLMRRLRVFTGMTQAEAAKAIGVGQSALAQWELGISKPRLHRLKKIADVYGCNIVDLLEDETKSGADGKNQKARPPSD